MHFKKEGQKIRAWVDHTPIIRAMPERKLFFSLMSSLSDDDDDDGMNCKMCGRHTEAERIVMLQKKKDNDEADENNDDNNQSQNMTMMVMKKSLLTKRIFCEGRTPRA